MQTSFGEVDYAVGSPSSASHQGRVYICPNCFLEVAANKYKKSFDLLQDARVLQGTQFGEKFGHTVCAVDINGDGYHDLVVGAPLHASPNKVIAIGYCHMTIRNLIQIIIYSFDSLIRSSYFFQKADIGTVYVYENTKNAGTSGGLKLDAH